MLRCRRTLLTGRVDGVWLRVRAWARTRWRGAALVAALAGVAVGAVLALAAGARRTSTAPDRYTEAVGGDYDLVLFQPFGPPLTEAISELPGVDTTTSLTFVAAFPVSAEGAVFDLNPFAGDDQAQGGRVVDGRFTDLASANELTVNRTAAELLDVDVGDRLDVASYSQEQVERNDFRPGVELAGPSFGVTVVGIVDNPGDLDDPTPSVVFSGGLLQAQPDVGLVATIVAVRTEAGATATSVLDAGRAMPGGADLFEQEARIVEAGTRRAIRLHVVALWIVAGVAALVAVLIVGQLAVRQVRTATADDEPLRSLGYDRRQFLSEASIEAAIVAATATIVAIVVAIAASGAFPIEALRPIEPDQGVAIDAPVLAAGGATLVLTFVAAAVVTALRTTEARRARARVRPGLPEVIAAAGGGPSMVTGVRHAFSSAGHDRGRPVAITLSVIVGITGVVGSLLVATSLVRMIDEPRLWGADFDESYGNPFVPAAGDIVTPVADDPDVAGVTAATSGSLTIDGTDVPVLAYESVRGGVLPVILDGRVPSAPDEIALGRLVAQRIDRSIGDTVVAAGPAGDQLELRVVGYTVTPGDGGDGASMTYDTFQSLTPDATRNLVFVDFRDGAPPDVADRIGRLIFTPPDTGRAPTTVLAFDRVVPAPYALAMVLAVMGTAALAYHVGSSVRRRGREFAILRALGADRRQVRGAVHWNASSVAAVGLIVGVPAGIAIGTRIHRSIADSVGVVPSVAVPVVLVLVVVAGVVAIANLAAASPARRATRSPAATLLQEPAGADR